MLRRVRIKAVPKARTGYQVQGALANDVPAFGGRDYNAYIGEKPSEVKKTLTAVPRDKANLEAEGGETVIGNIDGSMMPSFYTIKGPRHSSGGVPLNLPDDSFIFSDTRSMKITDQTILKMFNAKPKKGGYTPAELSKKYDINKYRKILQDPNSDKMDRKTAEMMIKNYTMKLGALALAQESKKGFPQGVPELAKPYLEANGISEEDLLPQKEQPQDQMQQMQQMQEMPEGQEQMQGAPPTEMPNGEPIAQPQSMEQEMPDDQMMMQQPPMAYGGVPFFPYYPSEMAYGGYLPEAQDGKVVNQKKRSYTKEELSGRVPKDVKKGKREGEGWIDLGNGIYGRGSISGREWTGGGGGGKFRGTQEQYLNAICNRMKNGNLKGLTLDQVINDAKAVVDTPAIRAKLAPCVTIEEEIEYIQEEAPSKECPCLDDKGVAIPGKFAQKDPTTGECKPETCKPKERCECERADGTKYDPGMNDDGTCKDCEEEEEIQEEGAMQQQINEPEWWLQDTVNTMGAFGDLASLKKYMPWEARVDLEEPRPTFLDPTRELAAQSEQANIAAQAASSFAGPQALNARLSQTQGQAAAQAANTLSNYNNQNVNIANQFEANQVGVRNQEQMLNQQMANRVFDKNVVANQQFDNAKRQALANIRQAYNTAVTNKEKTHALNQMYPNYQTRPGVGGRVVYTPTEKEVDPGAKTATYGEKLKDLMSQGFSRETAEKMIMNEHKATYSQKGGSTPGYIYTDWPIFL